VTVLFTQTG